MQGDLKALRKSGGLSQAELGDALQLSGPYIGEMERGEKAVDIRTHAAALVAARRARYRAARASKLQILQAIADGFTFHAGHGPGTEAWRDETAELRAQMLADIEMYDELIASLDRS